MRGDLLATLKNPREPTLFLKVTPLLIVGYVLMLVVGAVGTYYALSTTGPSSPVTLAFNATNSSLTNSSLALALPIASVQY